MTIGGKAVHVGGMCKGSGMIHPNMATMLGVVTCDAAVEHGLWTAIIKKASVASFNSVGRSLLAAKGCKTGRGAGAGRAGQGERMGASLHCMHGLRTDAQFLAPTPSSARPHVAQITVDGDTSTNDCVIGLASGAAGNAPLADAASADAKLLESAVTALMQVGWVIGLEG